MENFIILVGTFFALCTTAFVIVVIGSSRVQDDDNERS